MHWNPILYKLPSQGETWALKRRSTAFQSYLGHLLGVNICQLRSSAVKPIKNWSPTGDHSTKAVNALADRHQMFHKLNDINRIDDSLPEAEFLLLMNKWDRKLSDYMRASEDQCRKFFMNHIDYSPEANTWLRRR